MYLIVIGWMYVVLMMSVAEATNTTGSVLGAIVTFFLYGVLPVVLVVYLMRTPQRRRERKAREAAEDAARGQQQAGDAPPVTAESAPPCADAALPEQAARSASDDPDAGRKAAGAAEPAGIAPMGKEP